MVHKLKTCFLVIFLLIITVTAFGQSLPMGGQFYQNQFLGNPAFAGIGQGLNVNVHFRNQWRVLEGSPLTQAVTGDYRLIKAGQENVGLGLVIYNEKAGLIGRTHVSGSYAYHLPLNDASQSLHFGISLGIFTDRLENSKIIADPDDEWASDFNLRKTYVDGDFGLGYTNDKLTIQGALPNLKTMLKKDVNNAVGNTAGLLACSYRISKSLDAVVFEPKLSIQAFRGTGAIWALGSNVVTFNGMVSLMGMYQSNNRTTLGMGLSYEKYQIQGFYTGQREAMGGDFEISLKVRLFNRESAQNEGGDFTYKPWSSK